MKVSMLLRQVVIVSQKLILGGKNEHNKFTDQTSRPPAIRFAIDEEDSPEESKKNTCELFSLS